MILVLSAPNRSIFAQIGRMASGLQTLPHSPWERNKDFQKEAVSPICGSGDRRPGLGASCWPETAPAPSFITSKDQRGAQTTGARLLCPPVTASRSSSSPCSEKSGPEVKD